MRTDDRLSLLILISFCLFASFVFAIVGVASDGWSNTLSVPLLHYYNTNKTKTNPLREFPQTIFKNLTACSFNNNY